MLGVGVWEFYNKKFGNVMLSRCTYILTFSNGKVTCVKQLGVENYS